MPKLIFQCKGKGFVSIVNNGSRVGVVVPLKEKNKAYNDEATVWKDPNDWELVPEILKSGVLDEHGMYSGEGIVQAFDDGTMELSVRVPTKTDEFIDAKTVCGASDLSMIRNELNI